MSKVWLKLWKNSFKTDIHKIALIKLQLNIASLNNIAATNVCNLNLFDFTVVLYVSFDNFILAVELEPNWLVQNVIELVFELSRM